MVYEVVHREPLYRTYNASTLSFAYGIKLVLDVIRVAIPLIIVFATHGLWKKTGTYRERPRVKFDGRYLVFIGLGDQYSFSTSLPLLESADESHYAGAQVDYQWNSVDRNHEELQIDIAMSRSNLSSGALVYFVFLKYSLDYHSSVEAEVALHDSLQLPNYTTMLTVIGRLVADQKLPFRWRERYEIFDPGRLDVEHYSPIEIARRIVQQPFNVRLDRKMQFQTSTSSEQSQYFHLTLRIVVAEDEFTYKTDMWELLKWAAVQYVVVLLVKYAASESNECEIEIDY